MAAEIIGRRDELLALETFLETVPTGGQALLLEGDAGIGKTVLWQEALRAADGRDFHVLRSCPNQSEAQVAFAAVGDLLAPALSGAVLQRLVPVQRRALETALLIREPEPDEMFPDTRVLGLALLSIVRALAEERPVLVALDDAQWLDASSAEVLTFMLRRLEAMPVAVLATVRGRPVEVPLGLDRTFDGFRRLPIEPLSVGAIHRLLWGRFGIAVPRPVIVRVHGITGGNPFFALELGRALVEGSIRAESADVELPESLRAVVAQRLGALPAHVRETLVAVAALAAPSIAVLQALGARASTTSSSPSDEAWSSSTASGFDSPIRCWRPPATRRCRCTEGAGFTDVLRSWMSISKSAPAISRLRRPAPTKGSQWRSTPRPRTPVRAVPLRLRPISPSARSR